jgi:hypothetical protein
LTGNQKTKIVIRRNKHAKKSLPIFTLKVPTFLTASVRTIAFTDHNMAAENAAISPMKNMIS